MSAAGSVGDTFGAGEEDEVEAADEVEACGSPLALHWHAITSHPQSEQRVTESSWSANRADALTLTRLRGSSDYRSCQHLAQRSVLTQLNGSPKTSVNTAVNTVLTHAPGKTRVYLQKTGYTLEIPGPPQCRARPTPRAPAPTAAVLICLLNTHTGPCTAHAWKKAAVTQRRPASCPGAGVGDTAPAVELTRTSSQTLWEL